jgi:hypothetical protein
VLQDCISTKYFPAERFFNTYLVYVCVVFPRAFGTRDTELCLNEQEAEAAEASWQESAQHLLRHSMRGGGKLGLTHGPTAPRAVKRP